MSYYRNVDAVEAFLSFLSGKCEPGNFPGSRDSDAKPGKLSFWFSEPYRINCYRDFFLVTEEAPEEFGTMRYYRRTYAYDGCGSWAEFRVKEFYHFRSVPAKVEMCSDVAVGILQAELDSAELYYDSKYVSLDEMLLAMLKATDPKTGSVYVSTIYEKDLYVDKNCLQAFIANVEAFITHLENLVECDYLTL